MPDTLTTEQAISVLPDGEYVHTFRGGGGLIIGADWKRADIVEAIEMAGTVLLTGPGARSMKHGICISNGGALYIETDEARLSVLDPQE